MEAFAYGPNPYRDRMAGPRGPDPDQEPLRTIRDCYTAQKDYLLGLQSEWYMNILFCHGIQNVNFNQETGLPVFTGNANPSKVRARINLMNPAVRRLKSFLMRNPGRREARSINERDSQIENAELYTRVMDWAYDFHEMPEMESEIADWLAKTGNCVPYMAWDPRGGELIQMPDGTVDWQGRAHPIIDPPFRWMWDPRATHYRKARWAIRRTFQPEEWVEERFPGTTRNLSKQQPFTSDGLFEFSLLNLTPLHIGGGNRNYPKTKEYIEIFEMFEVSSPSFPKGRIIVAAGSAGYPQALLGYSENNQYGCIPAIVMRLETVPGRLWGETPIKYLIDPQREFNRRRTQIIRNCDAVANPKLLVPDDGGVSPNQITDEVGSIIPWSAQSSTPPQFLQPAQLDQMVYEAERMSMDLINLIMSPAGFSDPQQDRSTSAVHAMAMQEEQAVMAQPMVSELERGYTAFWQLYINNFKKFAKWPQDIQPLGADASFRYRYLRGEDLTGDVQVRIVPGSMMPTSRAAAFATWNEMFKSGMADPTNPIEKKRALEDIGKGDMTRSWRDMAGDEKKARRNLMKIRVGEMVVPDLMDNPDVHLAIYESWMKTTDYEEWAAMNPLLDHGFRLTFQLFQIAANEKMMEQAMAQARMLALQQGVMAAIGPQAPPQPTSAGKVQGQARTPKQGNPMGGARPTMTQGAGRAPSPFRNEGGNPGK